MSLNISLIKYGRNEDNYLTEDDSKEIQSVPLVEELYKIIEDRAYIIKQEVLEEGTEDFYEIDVCDTTKLKDILNEIKNIVKENSEKICSPLISEEDEDKILNSLRLHLNVRNLIQLKIEKYNEDKEVFLVLN